MDTILLANVVLTRRLEESVKNFNGI